MRALAIALKTSFFALGIGALLVACGIADSGGGADPAPGAAGADADSGAAPAPGSSGGTPGAPACAVGPATGPLVVATTYGLVQGTKAGNVSAFLGIPFATPPLGALRFAPPKPAACWDGVKKATDFGPACAQAKTVGSGMDGQEDCLTINVWTPALTPASKAPVLMWMYGGANVLGSSSQDGVGGKIYDGQALADARKVVVVSFNYRVGALGFVAHPALSAASSKAVSGNYGLLDAILALHWVKDNIGAFGGDASKVMFFGESAGAFDTCALVSSPLANGLFASALMESGACDVPSMKDRYARGQDFAKTLHCDAAADVVACLRAAPIADVVSATGSFGDYAAATSNGPVDVAHANDLPFGANVDGYVLPDTPLHTIAAGKANAVALVVGDNANEANLFMPPGTVTSCIDYDAKVRSAYGAHADEVLALYPCDVLDPTRPYAQIVNDRTFACSSRRVLRALAKANKAPIYRYRFVHAFTYGVLAPLGAFHTAEIPFVFGSFDAFGYAPTPAETSLSARMQGYWTRFAATQSPNGASGDPAWEPYVASRDNAAILDETIGSKDGIATKECDYWDTLAAP